jgi:hypothetical protein
MHLTFLLYHHYYVDSFSQVSLFGNQGEWFYFLSRMGRSVANNKT